MIIAIDPGSEVSGLVHFDETLWAPVHNANAYDNRALLEDLVRWASPEQTLRGVRLLHGAVLVLEDFAPRGQPLYRQLVDTARWMGRFEQAFCGTGGDAVRVVREDVKTHITGRRASKDANVRAALIDRWGGKNRAIGRKADPGPLYGIAKHAWAALAVAVTFAERGPQL